MVHTAEPYGLGSHREREKIDDLNYAQEAVRRQLGRQRYGAATYEP